MMKLNKALLGICIVAACGGRACGHGNGVKIDLNQTGDALVVSGGHVLAEGFAGMSFDHGAGSIGEELGGQLVWGTPGFALLQRAALELQSPVSLEVLSRPDFSAAPLQSRWFWFWDDSSGEVQAAAVDPDFAISSEDAVTELTFTQFAGPSGGDSIELQIAQFGHHPVEFVLDEFSAAQMGVYGFFCRITSLGLAPSDPILIALNHGLSSEQFVEGAEAINRAAGIRGDYNDDLAVDGADFLAWQRQVGGLGKLSADGSLNQIVDGPDLSLWEEQFGDRLELDAAVVVPEPGGVVLAGIWAASFWARRRVLR